MAKKVNYWIPASFYKSQDENGNEVMKMCGIASTASKDIDGEEIDPEGLDLSQFTSVGTVNWHHGTKEHPTAIIGEPTVAKVTKKGLYVECMLYPSSKIAQQVYEVAQTLEKDSPTRRLGFSIEGDATERDPNNKKHITKASITGLAITHRPKNADTRAEIMKAIVSTKPFEFEDWEVDGKIILKADGTIDTADSKPLIREDIDGVDKTPGKKKKKKTKAGLKELEKCNDDYIKKAEQIADEINNIIINKTEIMKKNAEETKDTALDVLEKAWDALGISDNPLVNNLEKGKKMEEEEEEAEEEDDDPEEEEEESEEEDNEEEEKEEKKKKKPVKKAEEDGDIMKAITEVASGSELMFKSVGTVLKSMNEKLDVLQKANEDMAAELDYFKSAPQGRKSIAASALERKFGGADGLMKSHTGPVLHPVNNKTQILGAIDQMAFKGNQIADPDLCKAMTSFETTGILSPYAVEKLLREKNIVVSN